MNKYQNLGGNSNVAYYSSSTDSITVQFNDGSIYLYNYPVSGKYNVDEMIRLANYGSGLNSYIGRVVKKRYARKLR